MSLSITRTVLDTTIVSYTRDSRISPGVRGLASPVGGCTGVHPPGVWPDTHQVEDAGPDPAVSSVLPDDVEAGVLQHHSGPGPLDGAHWVRPETAG